MTSLNYHRLVSAIMAGCLFASLIQADKDTSRISELEQQLDTCIPMEPLTIQDQSSILVEIPQYSF